MSEKLSGKILQKLGITNSSKLMEKAFILIIIGVVILIAGNMLFPAAENNTSRNSTRNSSLGTNQPDPSGDNKLIDEYGQESAEKKLEELLSSISGVGKCKVMITYESTEEIIPVTNKSLSEGSTEEKDDSGGTRSISSIDTEETIVMEEFSGSRKPAVSKKVLPKAAGAVVVCVGGDNAYVRDAITKTIQALFDLPIHKIQVIKGS